MQQDKVYLLFEFNHRGFRYGCSWYRESTLQCRTTTSALTFDIFDSFDGPWLGLDLRLVINTQVVRNMLGLKERTD